MKMTINVQQASADICDTFLEKFQREGLEKHPFDLPFPNGIIKEAEDGSVIYTEEAQKEFNKLYKEVFRVMNNNIIEE